MSSERWSSKGLVVGVLLSVVIVALFVVRMDWGEFQGALADVRWLWVAGGCAGIAVTISVRALRWATLAGAFPLVGSYWNATVIGYVGNTLYPGRAGEVLRIAALRKSLGVPPGELLATALMDRMADVVALGLVAAYAGAYTTAITSDTLQRVVILLAAVPFLGLVVLLVQGERLKPMLTRLCSDLPGHWPARLPRWYGQALDAFASLRKHGRWMSAAALTLGAYLIDYTVLWMFLKAFAWQLPLGAALTVGVLLAIGSLLPAAPGYLGIYQIACVLGLAPFGIGESSALAYSIVAQGATVLMIGVLGVIAGARFGFRFSLTKAE